MSLQRIFSKVFLINLERRKDRLLSVLELTNSSNWPFCQPEIFAAIDGNKIPTPSGWHSGGGAWGCRQSHVAILQECIQNGTDSILVLEDDIVVRSTFHADCEKFFSTLPDNWDCLMLGGQHMQTPNAVAPGIVRTVNCQRTHAYAIRGRFLRNLYALWASPNQTTHIDWTFGPMQSYYMTYAPDPFLFGQSRSMSDINGRVNPAKFWQSPSGRETVLVLKCEHDLVRQLRYQFNVHTGYDRDSNDIDNGLHKIFDAKDGNIERELRKWINDLQWECVSEEGFTLGIWHPRITTELVRACWDGPVVEVRTLEDAQTHLSHIAVPQAPLWQTHVVLLHADKTVALALPFLHYGYWRDIVTGYDNGIRKWLQHRQRAELATIIETLSKEAGTMRSSIAAVWHPDITMEDVRQAVPHRQIIYLHGSTCAEIQKQWSDYMVKLDNSRSE